MRAATDTHANKLNAINAVLRTAHLSCGITCSDNANGVIGHKARNSVLLRGIPHLCGKGAGTRTEPGQHYGDGGLVRAMNEGGRCAWVPRAAALASTATNHQPAACTQLHPVGLPPPTHLKDIVGDNDGLRNGSDSNSGYGLFHNQGVSPLLRT